MLGEGPLIEGPLNVLGEIPRIEAGTLGDTARGPDEVSLERFDDSDRGWPSGVLGRALGDPPPRIAGAGALGVLSRVGFPWTRLFH